jgi:hypothetical protein
MANINHLLETLNNPRIPLVMHFDTPFKCGNYYLSTLAYTHPQLNLKDTKDSEDGVVIPLVHLLHNDQANASLGNFFGWFKDLTTKNCPRLLVQTKVLVMDREYKGQFMDNTHPVYSQDMLIKDLERFCRSKNLRKKKAMGTRNTSFYTRSITDLISCSDLEDYKVMRETMFNSNRMWTSPEGKLIAEYFKTKLEEAVIQRGGFWHLVNIGLPEGVNYDAWETYMRDLKSLQTNFRQTIDITAIRLFSFESTFHNNVIAAYYGTGKILAKAINYI